MATITKLASGNWRVQVRRKGCYAADTFRRRRDAEEWALDTERCIDQGLQPKRRPTGAASPDFSKYSAASGLWNWETCFVRTSYLRTEEFPDAFRVYLRAI